MHSPFFSSLESEYSWLLVLMRCHPVVPCLPCSAAVRGLQNQFAKLFERNYFLPAADFPKVMTFKPAFDPDSLCIRPDLSTERKGNSVPMVFI